MTYRVVSLLLAALAITWPASAQHGGPKHGPYKGLQARAIKALSPEQIDDLRNGRGMGLALAAELNNYPGPLHVIELAQELALAPATLNHMRNLFAEMKAETIPIGERLIAQEMELDQLFSSGSITPERLTELTGAIGGTNADLRAAHLKYHLEARALLTPAQIHNYAALRGYTGANHDPKRH